jgi:GNAT superfamily N-acetyltransferase
MYNKNRVNIKLIELKNSGEYKKIKSLYYNAFPIHERTPLFILLRKRKLKNVAFYCIYNYQEWIGFIYLIHNKNLLLIQYFAINDNFRSKGYGEEVISKIKNMYNGYRIILGIEKNDSKSKNDEQRIKRKRFYKKCGFRESGYIVKQHVPMELLIIGETVTPKEVFELFQNYVGNILSFLLKNIIMKRIIKESEKNG